MVHARHAILDGEIVCLAADGRSKFYDLMFHRGRTHFVVFDVLAIDGEDLRQRPLLNRKRRLRGILPRSASRIMYLDHVERRGMALFNAVLRDDLEGIVAKWKYGQYYTDGQMTSWLKVRNPEYSQVDGRHDVFASRRVLGSPSRATRPVLALDLAANANGSPDRTTMAKKRIHDAIWRTR